MDRLLQSYLGRIKVGEEQTHKNLTAYPVLSNRLSALDYITLDEALKQGLTEQFYSDERLASPALRAMKAEHVGRRWSPKFGQCGIGAKKMKWVVGPYEDRNSIMATLCTNAGVKYFR